MGQNLGIVKVVEVAGEAGFEAIEPWLRELDAYVKSGGSLRDLGKRIAGLGLTVKAPSGSPRGSSTTMSSGPKAWNK